MHGAIIVVFFPDKYHALSVPIPGVKWGRSATPFQSTPPPANADLGPGLLAARLCRDLFGKVLDFLFDTFAQFHALEAQHLGAGLA